MDFRLRLELGAAAAVLAALVASAARPAASSRQSATVNLPAPLETYLTSVVRAKASERQALISGKTITKLLEADASKEVAVFGAVWIAASPAQYVARVKDIENFERGEAFRITKRISDPPKLEDFDAMKLSDEDFEDLKSCHLGDCELKLGEEALTQLQAKVAWSKPGAKAQADAIFRRLAFEYVNGYREGGNARLAVYRDAARATFVATEFRTMIEQLPTFISYSPDLRRYLLEYPSASLAGASDFLYWQEAQFGLKPTIRINHVIVQDRPDATIVASKMLYASHYFWTALEIRVLLRDPSRGAGFWFITVSRSRSDGLSGFVGSLIRGRVRGEAEKGTLAALLATKNSLEQDPPGQ